jgi:hypothetical protein
LGSLRQEIDRLFHDFGIGAWRSPFRSSFFDMDPFRRGSFGSFERSFPVPDGVELDKVDASFKKGVLTVTLPKTAEAQKAEKKITVKAG